MKLSARFIQISSVACIIACIIDFAGIFIAGALYPGYNHLKDTISSLGASVSPVADEMSVWWIFLGLVLIIFGIGFRKAFNQYTKYGAAGSWIIILYGIGEGIGSGAFKANHIPAGLTLSLIIHDTLGGFAVLAILALPLVMQKLISKEEMPWFHRLSRVIFVTGTITVLLFMFRYLPDESNFITIYKGLWQRLLSLNIYFYLVTIGVIILKKTKVSLN